MSYIEEALSALPFAEEKGISLLWNYDELILQIGNHRRNFILPGFPRSFPVEGSRFEKGELETTFRKPKKRSSQAIGVLG